MKVKISAVKFKIDEKLEEFITKKVSKLEKLIPSLLGIEVTLKEEKAEAELNKKAEIRLLVAGYDLFSSKQSDNFEAATMLCVDALKAQIDKYKDKWQ